MIITNDANGRGRGLFCSAMAMHGAIVSLSFEHVPRGRSALQLCTCYFYAPLHVHCSTARGRRAPERGGRGSAS